MKKGNTFIAYLLIIIGLFFLLRQLKIPILTNFYTWQTMLIIIGSILLFYSFFKGHGKYLFSGTILLGLGIHFYGIEHYHFWSHHWGMYTLIIGLAFIVRALKTRKGYIIGILLLIFSIAMIFSDTLNSYFYWLHDIVDIIVSYWAILLILFGFYMLRKKK